MRRGFLAVLAPEHTFIVNHQCKFPYGKAIYIRYGILADERKEARFHETSFHLVPAERVGTVEDNDLYIPCGAFLHDKPESAYECIGTGADILYVIYHYIYPLQHVRGGAARIAVQGIYRQTRGRISEILHFAACIYVPPYPVFRAEKRHELHSRGVEQYVYRRVELPVHPARICHKPHALAFQHTEALFPEHFYAGFHNPPACKACIGEECRTRQTYTYA